MKKFQTEEGGKPMFTDVREFLEHIAKNELIKDEEYSVNLKLRRQAQLVDISEGGK